MGCGAPVSPMLKSEKGIFPARVSDSKNPNVQIKEKVYLFGGTKILEFCTKTLKITEVKAGPDVKIPIRTACLLLPGDLIVTVGGMMDSKPTKSCQLFKSYDFQKAHPLPDLPEALRYTSIAFKNDVLFVVGGQKSDADPDGIVDTVYRLGLKNGQPAAKWELHCKLPLKRMNANLCVVGDWLFVFGGYSGSGNRSTQIDRVQISVGNATKAAYRLPLGVDGARLAWHGDHILFIGGKRVGERPDANVMLLDFENKACLSVRDLNAARDFAVILPTKKDELIVCGGSNNTTAERRLWCPETNDYVFRGHFLEGQNLIENPTHYSSALPTFCDDNPNTERWPRLDPKNAFIFGNEVDCFLVEISDNLKPYIYFAPLLLQQKNGQVALRFNQSTLYFIGGTDITRTRISSKSYKLNLDNYTVEELGKLNVGRFYSVFLSAGNHLFAIGGRGENGVPLADVESLDTTVTDGKWVSLAKLSKPRVGHSAWSANGKIFVLGGTTSETGTPSAELEIYSIEGKTWTVSSGKIPSPRFQDEPSSDRQPNSSHKRHRFLSRGSERSRTSLKQSLQSLSLQPNCTQGGRYPQTA